jgi:hypothetical protein
LPGNTAYGRNRRLGWNGWCWRRVERRHWGHHRRYLNRRYLNRRYLNRRYLDRRYLNRRYLNRRYLDRR